MPRSLRQGWVISDGRRGIENQALGLLEAISRLRPVNISKQVIDSSTAFKAATPKLQLSMRGSPLHYDLTPPYPDIAIGCGRQAIAPLIALKKAARSVFTVYIQDPRLDVSYFDLVVAPEHDEISGPNVEIMIGAPNRITNTEIIAHVLQFGSRLADLPMPRVAMLIGGHSKTHTLSPAVHNRHMEIAQNIIQSGRSLLITTSRRTPEKSIDAYKQLSEEYENVWFYEGGDPNPYWAFLGAAETILVTKDSTNMLTDACTAGKSVMTLPMDGSPGKFKILYDRLKERCHVVPFEGTYKTPSYERLNETARIAQIVLERYDRA